LEKARFIRRERVADDRRKVIVKVLPGGAQKIERIMGPLSQDMNQAMQDFTEDELKAVLKFFDVTAGAVSRHLERIDEHMQSKRERSRRSPAPT
jgi:DNA-binding PadR family transcriptional regulator